MAETQRFSGEMQGGQMTYRKAVCRGTVSAVALVLMAAVSGSAQAQGTTPPSTSQPAAEGPVEKVTVTGSHIKRRRESTSLPVDVVTSEDLEKDGARSSKSRKPFPFRAASSATPTNSTRAHKVRKARHRSTCAALARRERSS